MKSVDLSKCSKFSELIIDLNVKHLNVLKIKSLDDWMDGVREQWREHKRLSKSINMSAIDYVFPFKLSGTAGRESAVLLGEIHTGGVQKHCPPARSRP